MRYAHELVALEAEGAELASDEDVQPVPDRIGLPSELQRGVVGDRGVRSEVRRDEVRVDRRGMGVGARGYRRVQPPSHAEQAPGGDLLREETIDGPWAPVGARRGPDGELVAREDRMGGEEVGGPHWLNRSETRTKHTCFDEDRPLRLVEDVRTAHPVTVFCT